MLRSNAIVDDVGTLPCASGQQNPPGLRIDFSSPRLGYDLAENKQRLSRLAVASAPIGASHLSSAHAQFSQDCSASTAPRIWITLFVILSVCALSARRFDRIDFDAWFVWSQEHKQAGMAWFVVAYVTSLVLLLPASVLALLAGAIPTSRAVLPFPFPSHSWSSCT